MEHEVIGCTRHMHSADGGDLLVERMAAAAAMCTAET